MTITSGSIDKLDLHSVLEILSHTDCHTVSNFLTVFPYYKRHAVLFTDHLSTPYFFDPQGIKRAYVDSNHTESRKRLGLSPRGGWISRKAAERYPIKLIELTTAEVMDEMVKLYPALDGLDVDNQIIPLTSTTFMFLRSDSFQGWHILERLIRRLDEFTLCNWQAGNPIRYHDALTIHKTFPAELNTSGLVSLRLTDVGVLRDLSFDALKNLFVIYHQDYRENPPLISGLNAPCLQRFTVHYREVMPLFENLHGISTEPISGDLLDLMKYRLRRSGISFQRYYDWEEDVIKVFELARIGHMDLRSTTTSKDSDSGLVGDDLKYTTLDLSFFGRFNFINLLGVPADLLSGVDLTGVGHLRWYIDKQPILNRNLLEADDLLWLVMATKTSDVTLPSFKAPLLSKVWLYLMEERTANFPGLWKVPGYDFELTTLSIYSAPRLLRRPGHVPFRLSRREWRGPAALFSHYQAIAELSLIGFEMPFLQLDPADPWSEIWGTPTCCFTVLRPVLQITPSRGRNNQFFVNAFSFRRLGTRFEGCPLPAIAKVVVSPYFLSTSTLDILDPTQGGSVICRFAISTEPVLWSPTYYRLRSFQLITSKSFNNVRRPNYRFLPGNASQLNKEALIPLGEIMSEGHYLDGSHSWTITALPREDEDWPAWYR